MKTMRKVAIAASVMLLALAGNATAEDGARRGGRGNQGNGRHERMREAGRKLRTFVEKNLPGAKEEFERHETAMKAIREKMKAFGKETREAVRAAEGEEAKKAVVENAKEQLKTYAAEIVDERLRHGEKMLELRKANRDAAVEKTAQFILARAAERNQGRRGRGPNAERGGPAIEIEPVDAE